MNQSSERGDSVDQDEIIRIRNKIEKEGRLVDNNKNRILKSYLYLMEHKSMGIPSLEEVSSYCNLSKNTVSKYLKNIVKDLQGDTFEANALRQLLMKITLSPPLFFPQI